LISAIVSGRVLLRGVPPGASAPHLIDAREIEKPTSLEISGDQLRKKGSFLTYPMADYWSVAVDREELEAHVANMAPPPTPVRPPSKERVRRAIAESVAIHPNWSRRAHCDEIQKRLPGMSEREFLRLRAEMILDGSLPKELDKKGRRKGT
jgi:hypothetical protein